MKKYNKNFPTMKITNCRDQGFECRRQPDVCPQERCQKPVQPCFPCNKPILCELNNVKDILKNPCYGLKEIKNDTAQTNSLLKNPNYGLAEIKSEVRAVEKAIVSSNRTTGPVPLQSASRAIQINLSNNTNKNKVVTATIYNLTDTTKTSIYSTGNIILLPNSTVTRIYSGSMPNIYEVQFTGLVPGVYAFTASKISSAIDIFIPSNTFNHSDLIPTIN